MNMQVSSIRSYPVSYAATDRAVQSVRSVSATASAVSAAAQVSNSALTSDQVSFSARAQQILAGQSADTSLPYGTALASAEAAASGVSVSPTASAALQGSTEQPQDITAVYPVRAATTQAATASAHRRAQTTVSAGKTAQQAQQADSVQQSTSAQRAISTGAQRYLQVMQSTVVPQMQPVAVAMNFLA